MSVTIELSPEIETGLSVQANARGLPLSEHLRRIIEEQVAVPVQVRPLLPPAERAAAWRDTKHLPVTPPLSDEAISRESMYGPRGW